MPRLPPCGVIANCLPSFVNRRVVCCWQHPKTADSWLHLYAYMMNGYCGELTICDMLPATISKADVDIKSLSYIKLNFAVIQWKTVVSVVLCISVPVF